MEELRTQSGEVDTYRCTVRLPSMAESLTLFLSYREQEVDRQTLSRMVVSGENARIASYALSDPSLDVFRKAVEPQERKNLKNFEEAVRLLFTFLGFSCLKPLASDSVDIIGFTDNPRQVLLVECTTGAPDLHNKVGKLASRRNAYRAPWHPIALIATSLPIDEVSVADRERARTDDIVLLSRESLTELLTIAIRGTTPRSVLEYLTHGLGQPP